MKSRNNLPPKVMVIENKKKKKKKKSEKPKMSEPQITSRQTRPNDFLSTYVSVRAYIHTYMHIHICI